MDHTPQHFMQNSALNKTKKLRVVCDAVVADSTSTALCLDSHGISISQFSQGNKRKQRVSDGFLGLQDCSPLDIGLGCSSIASASKKISATAYSTMFSMKEIESLPLTDLGLNFNLCLGNERTPKPTKIPCATPKVLEVERHKLDLELSLSTGPIESDLTCVTPGSCISYNSNLHNAELPVLASSVQLVDEGSSSSRWKSRNSVTQLQILKSTGAAAASDNVLNLGSPTPVVSNFSSTMITVPGSAAANTSSIRNQQQQHITSVKTCEIKGCPKGARGASGRCIAHGGGRRCKKSGCQKGAEGKTVFCKAHGGGRRCQHLGCTKSAEGRTDYCIAHGGGKRCSYEGCTRAARGKSGLCIRHGGGKRCKIENCTKSAEGISGLCISHGGGRRCQYPACSKGAQGSTMYCKAHGGGKRCTAPGCTKGAEGSTTFCKGHGGGKRCTFQGGGVCPRSVHGGTLFCVAHGGGKRCAVQECTKSARGRTAYCVRHGGGKRCLYEGCGKSAQGSTDFCKAHGGGKRCSWGLVGSEFGGLSGGPCDKFARGKTGLCAAHSAQVLDKQVHGGYQVGSALQDAKPASEKIKEPVTVGNSLACTMKSAVCGGNLMGLNGFELRGVGHQLISMQIPGHGNYASGNSAPVQFSLPEGRVHGGGLMAMLRGSSGFVTSGTAGPVEPGKSSAPSWV